MKVLVPVKQVATLDDEFELADDAVDVDPDFVDFELNEWDSFSVEAALTLRDEGSEGEVVVVTVGPEGTDEALLSCLAMGADRAARVWDDALTEADALAVGRVLAAVVEREQPDLVLCGVQSSDAVFGATGIATAGFTGLLHVAVCTAIEYDAAATSAVVSRELEGGLVERLRVPCPALLTIQTGINQPRYANLRAIKQARHKPLDVLALEDVGLTPDAVAAAAGADVRRMALPRQAEGAQMLDGSPAEVAERIAALVQERVA